MGVGWIWIQVVFFGILFNSYEERKNALSVLFCSMDLMKFHFLKFITDTYLIYQPSMLI